YTPSASMDGEGDDHFSYTVGSTCGTTVNVTVHVHNAPPTATISNNGPINEGSNATATLGSPIDPSSVDAGSLHYFFSTSQASRDAATYGGSGASNTGSFATNDNGPVIIYARILDKDGGFTDYQTTVTVTNV